MRGQELQTIVIYDVEDDRTRLRIAKACRDYGLEHIQYSAYRGPLGITLRKELFGKLKDIMADRPGRILVVPLCDKDAEACQELNRVP